MSNTINTRAPLTGLIETDPTTTTPSADFRLSLRPREVAAALGIGERKLWELTNRGEIPVVRLGKALVYPLDSLRTWLAGKTEGGRP